VHLATTGGRRAIELPDDLDLPESSPTDELEVLLARLRAWLPSGALEAGLVPADAEAQLRWFNGGRGPTEELMTWFCWANGGVFSPSGQVRMASLCRTG